MCLVLTSSSFLRAANQELKKYFEMLKSKAVQLKHDFAHKTQTSIPMAWLQHLTTVCPTYAGAEGMGEVFGQTVVLSLVRYKTTRNIRAPVTQALILDSNTLSCRNSLIKDVYGLIDNNTHPVLWTFHKIYMKNNRDGLTHPPGVMLHHWPSHVRQSIL